MQERRKSKRIELDAKIIVKRLDSNIEHEVSIDVCDVSKTGIGFQTTTVLEIGAVYQSYLTLWNKDVIHAFIEIVRIVKEEDTFVYGGVFIGMPEMDQKRIEIYDTIETTKKQME